MYQEPILRHVGISILVLTSNVDRLQAIVSEAARVLTDGDDERFLDPRSKQTFLFDQLTLVSIVVLPSSRAHRHTGSVWPSAT
jgi:hypothetical protein